MWQKKNSIIVMSYQSVRFGSGFIFIVSECLYSIRVDLIVLSPWDSHGVAVFFGGCRSEMQPKVAEAGSREGGFREWMGYRLAFNERSDAANFNNVNRRCVLQVKLHINLTEVNLTLNLSQSWFDMLACAQTFRWIIELHPLTNDDSWICWTFCFNFLDFV